MTAFARACVDAASEKAFSDAASTQARAKAVTNWIVGDLTHLLSAANREIADSPVKPAALAEMLDLMDDGTISVRMAHDVFEAMFETGVSPARVVEDQGLSQISDEDALLAIVRQAIEANPKAVVDFQKGKSNAVGFLVGQVMRETRGQANPQVANQLVVRELNAAR